MPIDQTFCVYLLIMYFALGVCRTVKLQQPAATRPPNERGITEVMSNFMGKVYSLGSSFFFKVSLRSPFG